MTLLQVEVGRKSGGGESAGKQVFVLSAAAFPLLSVGLDCHSERSEESHTTIRHKSLCGGNAETRCERSEESHTTIRHKSLCGGNAETRCGRAVNASQSGRGSFRGAKASRFQWKHFGLIFLVLFRSSEKVQKYKQFAAF